MDSLGSFSSLVLALSLVFFSYQPTIFLSADNALIQKLCSKTVDPGICSNCLNSDPAGKSADAKGLAGIAVNCAERDCTKLYNDTRKAADNAPAGELKNVLEDCAERFFDAQSDFQGVRQNVQSGAYDLAKGVIHDQILPQIDYCIGQFVKAPQLPIPSTVLGGSIGVKDLCDAITVILTNISG
ncbi:PREDICTED: uncharacterized protein LOC104606084 [Nelumbo nucifera]|uniref:Uncharacterized protein LOC104606084 n=1 Tax=Nelumbo nucifera TaxID=4432 RepID=A0A1U8B0R4_NELNU|nr:PREDICTED: uncharacterized protein LOC104606084 [Nelumbo nucifera]